MINGLRRLFTTSHTKAELEKEIYMAEVIVNNDGTAFPDSSFEEGYIAAINFILGNQGSNVEEEFSHLMDELNEKA